MFSNLKKKDDQTKKKIALLGATLFCLVITVVWIHQNFFSTVVVLSETKSKSNAMINQVTSNFKETFSGMKENFNDFKSLSSSIIHGIQNSSQQAPVPEGEVKDTQASTTPQEVQKDLVNN